MTIYEWTNIKIYKNQITQQYPVYYVVHIHRSQKNKTNCSVPFYGQIDIRKKKKIYITNK